jgi:hypothetical protein
MKYNVVVAKSLIKTLQPILGLPDGVTELNLMLRTNSIAIADVKLEIHPNSAGEIIEEMRRYELHEVRSKP